MSKESRYVIVRELSSGELVPLQTFNNLDRASLSTGLYVLDRVTEWELHYDHGWCCPWEGRHL